MNVALNTLVEDPNVTPGNRTYIRILVDNIKALVNLEKFTKGIGTIIKGVVESLTSLLVTFTGSSAILIYAERLKLLSS